jgi:hypothetical protein
MATPPSAEIVQKVAMMCATEQSDDLRMFIPVTVPPDQNVRSYSNSRSKKFLFQDSDTLEALYCMCVRILVVHNQLHFY